MLPSIAELEKVVQQYARTIAPQQRIQPGHFEVHLVTVLERGHMHVIPGGVVQIIIVWPDLPIEQALPKIRVQLESAFALIRRHGLRRTMEIIPISYIKQEGVGQRKWFRKHFGDIGETIHDLIPRHRLRVITTTTTIIQDVITGENISSTITSRPGRFDGNDIAKWLELSRIVNEKHPSEPDIPDSDLGIVEEK